MNITNGRRANRSHPLPIWWYFIILILLNVLHVSTWESHFSFSCCLNKNRTLLNKFKSRCWNSVLIWENGSPPAQKTPCQAKLTIATVQGPEWKHLWFLQRFVIHIFIQLQPIHFFYLYHLRKYPINLDHRNQPHPVFNHWEYTFQDKQSQFKTVPTLLLVCTWLCRRLCC